MRNVIHGGQFGGWLFSPTMHLGFDGEDGTGSGGGTGDNVPGGQGNSGGDSGTPGSDSNNDGIDFDPETFWDGPALEQSAAPSGESAGGGSQESGTPPNFAQQLTSQIGAMNFGEPVLTAEIAEEINQGNYANFEKRIQTQLQTAVRQSLATQVQILRPFAEQILQQMRDEMGSTLGDRDNNDQLVKDFPAASNPKIRPVIQNVYAQALKNTGNDRVKAVAMTKSMIQLLANTTADDLNLEIAPRGAGDSRPQSPAVNWLDELTGR